MAPSSPIKITVAIVHHHGLEMFRDCLASIYSAPPGRAFEVIVVDNASIDGADEMLAHDFSQVKTIRNDRRYGFGHNQNIAMTEANGEHVFILNDDTIVHEGAIDRLSAFLDSNQDVGLVGPRLLNSDGSTQLSCYKFPSPLRCLWENLLLTAAFPDSPIFGDYRAFAHDTTRDVDFVIGAAMMVRKKVIDQVGLFDPIFFMYSEETDWQKRIHQAGWRVVFYPQSEITHIGGKSSEGMQDRQFCEFQKSATKFMRKHYGVPGLAVQRAAMIFGALFRISVWSALYLMVPQKRERAATDVQKWLRLLKWWAGFGPHLGLCDQNAQ